MSVPTSKRSENKLQVQQCADDLIAHTVRITANAKVFDPSYHVMVERVVDMAIRIGTDLWEANGIRVCDDPERWRVRHGLQMRACRHLDDLLYLITLCKSVYHLRERKYHAWVEKARNTRDLARKWRDSDVKRYGRLGIGA